MKLCCPMNQLSLLFIFCLIECVIISNSLPQNKIFESEPTLHLMKPESVTLKTIQKNINLSKNLGSKCPNSTLFMSYRYDEDVKKCGIIGRKEHCSDNMIFYSLPDSDTLGICDCIPKLGDKPLIYYPKTKKCYFTYEQSYCRTGQWLTFNRYGNPVCTRNICLTNGRSGFGTMSEEIENNIVPFKGNGECVRLNEGYKQCKSDEIITFISGRLTPQCGKKIIKINVKIISPVSDLTCEPGSFISLSGRCQPSYVW